MSNDPIITSLDQLIDLGFMSMAVEEHFWKGFAEAALSWSSSNKIPLKFSQFDSLQRCMFDFATKQTESYQRSAEEQKKKWESMPVDFIGIIGTKEEADVYVCYLETFWPFTNKTAYPDRRDTIIELDKLHEFDHFKKHTKANLPNKIRYEICRALQYLLIMEQRRLPRGFGPNVPHIRDTLRTYEFLIHGSHRRKCKKELEKFTRKELLAIWHIISNSFSGLC